jgi:hypothetical protein
VTHTVSWGLDEQTDDTNQAQVSNASELDRLLDTIEALRGDNGTPFAVTITADNDPDAHKAIQLGAGHPHRAFLLLYGEPGGYAYQTDLPPWPEPIGFDLNGEATDYKPARTRITPETMRAAVHEYITTGQLLTVPLDPDA